MLDYAQTSIWNLSSMYYSKPVKVSKLQKHIFLFSFEPKTERNYFLNSALGSKFFYLTHFRSLRQKSKNNFVRFLVQMRLRKFAFEIHWTLVNFLVFLLKQ